MHLVVNEDDGTHEAQLRTAIDLFLSLAEPAILLGDLNEVGSHPAIVRLLNTPRVRNALANSPRTNGKQNPIDWIITRGFRTVRAEWMETAASDHPVARAELELSTETAGEPRRDNHRTLSEQVRHGVRSAVDRRPLIWPIAG